MNFQFDLLLCLKAYLEQNLKVFFLAELVWQPWISGKERKYLAWTWTMHELHHRSAAFLMCTEILERLGTHRQPICREAGYERDFLVTNPRKKL